MRRKAEVDNAQKPLQDELNDIKKKILDFDQKRSAATVSYLCIGMLWLETHPLV